MFLEIRLFVPDIKVWRVIVYRLWCHTQYYFTNRSIDDKSHEVDVGYQRLRGPSHVPIDKSDMIVDIDMRPIFPVRFPKIKRDFCWARLSNGV
jgi:hypothetical protein